jgi:hypothetical protein
VGGEGIGTRVSVGVENDIAGGGGSTPLRTGIWVAVSDTGFGSAESRGHLSTTSRRHEARLWTSARRTRHKSARGAQGQQSRQNGQRTGSIGLRTLRAGEGIHDTSLEKKEDCESPRPPDKPLTHPRGSHSGGKSNPSPWSSDRRIFCAMRGANDIGKERRGQAGSQQCFQPSAGKSQR